MRRILFALTAFVLALAGGFGAVAQDGGEAKPPGEGVLCSWAIFLTVGEVGRRCFSGQDAEFQKELDDQLTRFEQYVIQNSDPPLTADEIATFKRLQGNVGAPLARVCRPDALGLYRAVVGVGAARLRQSVDSLLARPGPPTWGVCL